MESSFKYNFIIAFIAIALLNHTIGMRGIDESSHSKPDDPSNIASSSRTVDPSNIASSSRTVDPSNIASSSRTVDPSNIASSSRTVDPSNIASSSRTDDPSNIASSSRTDDPSNIPSSSRTHDEPFTITTDEMEFADSIITDPSHQPPFSYIDDPSYQSSSQADEQLKKSVVIETLKSAEYELTYNEKNYFMAEPVKFFMHHLKLNFKETSSTVSDLPVNLIFTTLPIEYFPVLIINGEQIHATPIEYCKLFAELGNISGENFTNKIQIDVAVDEMYHLYEVLISHVTDPNITTRETKLRTFINNDIPTFLIRYNQYAEKTGYLFNEQLTWPDVYFTSISQYLCRLTQKDILNEYPNLKKVTDNVLKAQQILHKDDTMDIAEKEN